METLSERLGSKHYNSHRRYARFSNVGEPMTPLSPLIAWWKFYNTFLDPKQVKVPRNAPLFECPGTRNEMNT